jgi:hypothetical protein
VHTAAVKYHERVQENEEEAPNKVAAEPTDALACNRESDRLPGGTVVVWGGRRPAWFSASHQLPQPHLGEHAPSPEPVEAQHAVCREGTRGDAERLSLSEKQCKKCLKVAFKMLKQCRGGVRLKQVVDGAVAALKLSQSADAGKLRAKVRTVIKKGDGWSIQGGRLMEAIAVSS